MLLSYREWVAVMGCKLRLCVEMTTPQEGTGSVHLRTVGPIAPVTNAGCAAQATLAPERFE
jgi:hypothetical protein